jgi:phosphoadenosine phosphosulfate reductase
MQTQVELTAPEVIREQLAGNSNACLTCSFQAEDMVVLHLAREVRPDIPVLFLETGYHFADTYAYRDRMAKEWNLNLVNLMPALPLAEQEAKFGKLYQSKPAECCNLRKVEPLFRGLSAYDVWLTGLRREQSPTRANLKKVETHILPDGRPILKISALADWTNRDVWAYLKQHSIEPMPLYDKGYTSIGCEPCTQLPLNPDDPRSGRWAGAGKLECGIHTFSEKR